MRDDDVNLIHADIFPLAASGTDGVAATSVTVVPQGFDRLGGPAQKPIGDAAGFNRCFR